MLFRALGSALNNLMQFATYCCLSSIPVHIQWPAALVAHFLHYFGQYSVSCSSTKIGNPPVCHNGNRDQQDGLLTSSHQTIFRLSLLPASWGSQCQLATSVESCRMIFNNSSSKGVRSVNPLMHSSAMELQYQLCQCQYTLLQLWRYQVFDKSSWLLIIHTKCLWVPPE